MNIQRYFASCDFGHSANGINHRSFVKKIYAPMKKNMGSSDRIARALAGISLIILIVTGIIQGTATIILSVLVVVFLLTSAAGYCPLYPPFGINTLRKDLKQEKK